MQHRNCRWAALALLLGCADAPDVAPVQEPSGGAAGSPSSSGAATAGGTGGATAGSGAMGGSAGDTGNGGTPAISGAAGQAGAPGGSGGASSGSAGESSAGGSSAGGSAAGQAQGGGGTGGGGSYAPCPTDGSACRILPFGDSITFGYGSSDAGGYRSPLYARILEGGYRATFVGSQSGGPNQVEGKPFPKQHEGRSGWTIDSGYVSFGQGISTLVPQPAFATVPHIVLLMIGTNDVGASMGTSSIADRLDKLLGKIIEAAPQALIVVAKITPIKYNPAPLAPYNAKIPDVVKARNDQGQHLALVDMSQMPVADLASDSLHPNDAGYAWMAGTWYAAIKDYLPR